jgi:hypothetical protein
MNKRGRKLPLLFIQAVLPGLPYFHYTENTYGANGYYANGYGQGYITFVNKPVAHARRSACRRGFIRRGRHYCGASIYGKASRQKKQKQHNCNFFHISLSYFLDFQEVLW